MSPHISIKGETVYELIGFPVTNSFITTILVVICFSFIAHYYYSEIRKETRSLVFYAIHGLFNEINYHLNHDDNKPDASHNFQSGNSCSV